MKISDLYLLLLTPKTNKISSFLSSLLKPYLMLLKCLLEEDLWRGVGGALITQTY